MKRSSFLKRLFAGAIGLTTLPAVAENLSKSNITSKELVAPIEPDVEEVKRFLPTSINRPISIRVENTSPNLLRRIDIINTNGSAINPYITQKGELLIPGGKVYSTTPEVSYQQIIEYIMSCPFMAGKVFVKFDNQSAKKNSLTVVSKDANGNRYSCVYPFSQYQTPYDYDLRMVVIDVYFPVDLFTCIQLYELKPGCKADISIYPLVDVNPARKVYEDEICKLIISGPGQPGNRRIKYN